MKISPNDQDYQMAPKPTYKELEQRIIELEKEILEYRQIDERFRNSEFRFTISQQVGHIGSWDRNLKTGEVYWSDQNYIIRGFEPQAVTPSLELVKSQVHPDDFKRFIEMRDAALYQKEPYHQRYRLIRKDGEIRIVSVTGKVEWDENGEPIRFLGTLQDITEHRRAEEDLRASEERFRDLAEGSIQGILIHRDYKPLFVNQAFASMYGYAPEEIMRMESIFPLSSPQDQTRLDKYKNNRFIGKETPTTYEFRGAHRDGSLIWLENRVRVIQWEGQSAIQATSFDITKRKQAEENLRESETKHKTLVHNIPGMVYRAYTDWSAEIISGSKEVSGYTNEELNTKEEGWLSIIHLDDKEKVFKEGSELAKRQQNVIQTYRIINKDGDIRWVEDRKTSLFNEEGEFKGIDGIVFDITDRKQAEKMLKQANEELEQRVEERTVELKAANEALEVQKKNLEEVNTALRVLLNKRDQDRIELEKKVLYNVKELVSPYLDRLSRLELDETQMALLGISKSNLNDIISSFTRNLSAEGLGLTPSEIEVSNLIRHGKTTKQITKILNLSSRTIETHRKKNKKKTRNT